MCFRYWHVEAVTTLAFSASCLQLASTSGCELAIWSPVTKAADKQKVVCSVLYSTQCLARQAVYNLALRCMLAVPLMQVKSKVTCLGWSPAGQALALALEDGCISLHDATGSPIGRMEHDGRLAALAWSPARHVLPTIAAILSQHLHKLVAPVGPM